MSNIKVTQEHIDDLLKQSEKNVETVFGKSTVVTIKLPNGYVLTETSACVDKDNYDKQLGIDICMEQIEHRLWELEGYALQDLNAKRRQMITVYDIESASVDFGKHTHSYLKFQQGIEPKFGVNGVQVSEVIRALISRMHALNEIKHDMYNDQTIESLESALSAQNQRDIDRKQRGIEGTEKD